MKWSKSYLFTLRDAPIDAEISSHKLMVRAGLIRKVSPGIFSYGHLALRAIHKFEMLVRDVLDHCGCQEILMPMVQPAELWQESNRWKEMGDSLIKFKNRHGQDFCLGNAHEEVVTDYVRQDVQSYRDLPKTLYQVQTQFRDEERPRFGLMRGREFIVKAAYSFDINEQAASESYQRISKAYTTIFSKIGLNFRIVEADPGNSQAHEFQVLAEVGEDQLMICDKCEFAANIEIAPVCRSRLEASDKVNNVELPIEVFSTPGLKTIAQLSEFTQQPARSLVKTLFFSASNDPDVCQPITVLLRGGDELNLVKLKNLLGLTNLPAMLSEKEVKEVTGAWPGSCGPVGLSIPIYMDASLVEMKNFIVGANRDDEHFKNVNPDRDFRVEKIADLRLAEVEGECPKCKIGHYKSFRGIEVGHVSYLGTKYSKMMNASFLNRDGEANFIEMCSYDIGVSRTVQAVVEQFHDKDGIVWPVSIAPFHVHICVLDPENVEVSQSAEILYRDLKARGLDVIMDDRIERPGVKFKDADLLGMPVRLNIGHRGLQTGTVEMIARRTKEVIKVQLEDVTDKTWELVRELGRI